MGRKKDTRKKKLVVDLTPGAWPPCAAGDHKRCVGGPIHVQAAWATAGEAPPTPDAKPAEWSKCPCKCHIGA